MDRRKEDLNKLKSYTNEIDKELTMILQTLQWDRKHLLEHDNMTACIYDANHKVLSTKVEEHQQECLLRHNGYNPNEPLLPDPADTDVSTLIKLDKEAISHIINNAAKLDPTFKRVCIEMYGSVRLYPVNIGCGLVEPLSLGRLQCAYTPDERRAIHDAVVNAAPSCHDLTDLALPSANDADETPKPKSRAEILAELRNMRRRRTKYRVAAKSRNYSDVLRDVIKTQMEHYNGAIGDVKPEVDQADTNTNKEIEHNDNGRNEHGREFPRWSGRDSDREQKKHERFNRDNRYGEERETRSIHERTDRRNKEDRDRRYSKRDDTDNRYRERAIKREFIEDDTHKVRSKDNSEDNYYNEKHQYERGHRKSDRESRRYRSREYDEDRNRGQRDSSKHRRHREMSDRERAKNLITEIKREIDSVERTEDNNSRSKLTRSESYMQIKQDKSYVDNKFITASDYKYEDKEKSNRNKSSEADYSRHDKHADMNLKNRRDLYDRYRKRDHDERRYREREHRIDKDNRDKSHGDRSRENERKRSRTEDKHRLYSEIYSELNNKKNYLNDN